MRKFDLTNPMDLEKDGFEALRGIGKEMFQQLGGGEHFLAKERKAFGSIELRFVYEQHCASSDNSVRDQ